MWTMNTDRVPLTLTCECSWGLTPAPPACQVCQVRLHQLRLDSWADICPFKTIDTSNESLIFSLSGGICCFSSNFLNQDFSLNIELTLLKLSRYINILMEGIMSQNFGLGLSFYFMSKNGKPFVIFHTLVF